MHPHITARFLFIKTETDMSQTDDNLQPLRHSLAHLLAAAVLELYPGAQNSIGPAIENGFYQDFDMPEPISEDDLPKIEKKMREILKTWGKFEGREVTPEEARKEFAWNAYKLELIEELVKSNTPITLYTSGSFIDLCRGGHLDDAKKINPKAFKLQKVSGAYWRGDQTKQQLQRVYGAAFDTPEALQAYLQQQEEAKKRDHRKLGQELDLFVFSDMVGSGLPMFTPRGTVLREQLEGFSNELRQRHGFEKVWVPHITKKDLYEASGHWVKFGDELFLVKSQETSDELVMKPMNCPHHTRIYASRQRSYRDLPIRYLETTTVYRDEKTGELGGLSRVRSITQDDSHSFCRQDQIESEINNLLDAANELYATMDMKLRVRLSYRDESDTYLGSKELWENAQKQLKNAVIANKLDYFEQEGEAAFYGPKIDFMATDAIGREHQVATVQLDFVQPERFGLEYTAEDGSQVCPVMIHCALLGSTERFLSVYIEHTAGKFPVWLAPEQIRLITVNQEDRIKTFAGDVRQQAKDLGLRVVIDDSNESVGKKIRNSELMKVPYTIVIGEKEIDTGQVTPRVRSDIEVQEFHQGHAVADFLKTVANEAKSRVTKTSL
jgi:threonyl-tRNA synthetase